MGIFNSKRRLNTAIPEISTLPTPQPYTLQNMPENIDDEVLRKLRKQLCKDVSTFILNNLLMSVQFFENYEKEIADLRISNVSRKENTINSELSEQQKHCLLPDTLHELIDKKVRFQPKHGPTKYITEPLHKQRILVAYDNIEVHNPSENSEYSSALDGPIYKCVIETAKLTGYVEIKLTEIEIKRKKSDRSQQDKSIPSPGPQIIRNFSFTDRTIIEAKYQRQISDDVFVSSKFKRSNLTPAERKINNAYVRTPGNDEIRRTSLPEVIVRSKQSDFYDYSKINEHYTPKPLLPFNLDNRDSNEQSTNLPSNCITTVYEQNLDNLYEETEEEVRAKYPNNSDYNRYIATRKPVELFDKTAYLNSFNFKQYFGDIFPRYIAEQLGFDTNSIENAMMQDATIYIDQIVNQHVINYEIIPSLTTSWPDDAFEWSHRQRPVVQDYRTQTAYRWPTQGMINRIKTLPCHIYPIGFVPKRGTNEESYLQWRLAFPAAERFLESHLFHAQIRCYLFTLVLYKTFIESKESKLGLSIDHIRMHLFWECEKNYVRWPEVRLGEKLRIFLEHLRQCLANHSLPDYFIPSRNLFENVPTAKLAKAHYVLVKILENPVMYLLRALSNLKYINKHFYPIFNYKKLYNALTESNVIHLMNPNIPKLSVSFYEPDEAYDSDDSEKKVVEDAVARWYQEAHRRIQEDKINQQKETTKRKSVESINLQVAPTKSMELIRQMLILKLFISHFIEMARTSNVFDTPQQGLMYIDHARNLTILLSELESGREDADDYFVQIRKVETLLKQSLTKEKVPIIPAKNIQLYNNNGSRINRLKKSEMMYGEQLKVLGSPSNPYVNVNNLRRNESNGKQNFELTNINIKERNRKKKEKITQEVSPKTLSNENKNNNLLKSDIDHKIMDDKEYNLKKNNGKIELKNSAVELYDKSLKLDVLRKITEEKIDNRREERNSKSKNEESPELNVNYKINKITNNHDKERNRKDEIENQMKIQSESSSADIYDTRTKLNIHTKITQNDEQQHNLKTETPKVPALSSNTNEIRVTKIDIHRKVGGQKESNSTKNNVLDSQAFLYESSTDCDIKNYSSEYNQIEIKVDVHKRHPTCIVLESVSSENLDDSTDL